MLDFRRSLLPLDTRGLMPDHQALLAKTDAQGRIDIDAQMPRMTSMMKAGYGDTVPAYVMDRMASALHSWNLGQTGIAITKLTQVGLPDPFTDPGCPARLVKAERHFDTLQKDDYDPGSSDPAWMNEARVPAGDPAGGQWTGAGGATSLDDLIDPIAQSDDSTVQLKGTSGMDIDAAVDHLNENAFPASKNQCAAYVENAINAGLVGTGKQITRPSDQQLAYQKGPYLEALGFLKLPSDDGNHPDGHMTMFNGEEWVSDYKQNRGTDPYPAQEYRKEKPVWPIIAPDNYFWDKYL
jgi:hypothetical protein